MNPWLAWVTFALVIVVLSLVGCHFSLRTLRVVTAFTAAASAVFITWYGLTHAAKAPGSLSDAFARGADALSIALFRVPPGRSGWVVIVVLLVIGYRQLEAWTLSHQAPSLDTLLGRTVLRGVQGFSRHAEGS